MLAGRLVFAVSWQPLAPESTPGGNTRRVVEQAAFGGAGVETSPGGFLSAQRPRPKARLGDKPLFRHRKRLGEAVDD